MKCNTLENEEVVLKVELDNNPNTQEESHLDLAKMEFGYNSEEEGKFNLRFVQDGQELTRTFKGRDQQLNLSLFRDGREMQVLLGESYAYSNVNISEVFYFRFEDGGMKPGFSFETDMGGKWNPTDVEYFFFDKGRDSLINIRPYDAWGFFDILAPKPSLIDTDGDSLFDCLRGPGMVISWDSKECNHVLTWITEYFSPSLKNDDIEFEDVTLRVAERNPALMSGFIQDVEELREKLQEWHPNEHPILETDLEDFLSKLKTEVKWTRLQQQWERIKKALEQI